MYLYTMLKTIRVFILLAFCLSGYIRAQEKVAERFLDVRGTSELNMEPLSRATANLYEGSAKVKSVQTGSDGSFSFRLDMNKQYTIEVEKNGLISKRISFNTTIPDEEKGTWMNEFSIGLVKKCDGVDYAVLNEPVDKVSFDIKRREFVSDKDYVTRLRPRIEGMMIKNDQCLLNKFEASVKKGDQLIAQKNLQEAISAYKEAQEIFPTETYPSKKIAEINAQITKQQNSTEIYKKIIEEADALDAQQRYAEALQKYKGATALNPQEAYPKQKITEIESSFAQQEAARQALQKTEDKYNQAMARASVAVTQKDYAQARQYYQEALGIKPGESVPKTRMAEIETILTKKAADEAVRAAENAKKAAFENDYKTVIALADEQFKVKKYDEAKQNYAKALNMKPSEAYPAQRIKSIDMAVATEQATMQKSRDDGYTAAVVAANRALAQNQFPLAKEYFQKALTFKPDDATSHKQLAEVDRQAEEYTKRKSLEGQYKKTISSADLLLQNKELDKAREAYGQALLLKPGDQYAQTKIASIDNLIAAEQAARLKATEEGYLAAIGAAKTAISQKSYTQAKEYLQKALSIKPGDAYATNKSAEVDRFIEEQRILAEKEKLMAVQYNETIGSADKLFNDREYVAAKASYNKALQIKPGDSYASQKISSINNILATELANKQKLTEDSFKSAMERGTNALVAKDYTSAKNAFQEALAIKISDISARAKLTETETLIRQEQGRIAADQARRSKYETMVTAADRFLVHKDYQNARISYLQASEILPNEPYPRQKLDEINKTIAEQERVLAEKLANENAYNLALANADKYFKAKDFFLAREEYSRALKLKPDAIYPKSKLAEMEDLIRLRQKEQDEAKARADAYTAAMNAGNSYFSKKEYAAANTSYQDALKQIPGDVLAIDQIKKIDNLLADTEKQKKTEIARKATYDAFIKSADNAYDAGHYALAKEEYKKALAIELNSAYAKQRIARIDEINRALSQTSVKTVSGVSASKPKIAAAIPLGELIFKSESERRKYLDELKKKYPAGITLEKYKEQYKETYRYIIIRENEAQEFRQIKFTTYNGSQYSVNGKPITQQYFLSQVKPRQGESYQEIDM